MAQNPVMPPTPYRQLALQGAAIILVLSLAWPYFGWKAEAMPWRETCLAIGGVAFAFATLSRAAVAVAHRSRRRHAAGVVLLPAAGMIRRRPDLLALIVALAGTLAVVAFLLWDQFLSRERELDLGTARTEHFGAMLGEHTARTYEAVNILLREIANDLSSNHQDWASWEASRGWTYVAERHTRSLPQLRDLIIFDRDGEQRFISTYFPPPRINVRDRPYFIALEQGTSATSFGPFIGRNSGRYTYALARRIEDAGRNFAGIVIAAIEPAYFSGHCWSNRLAEDFDSVIINARGQVVASCRPTELSRQSPILGALAVDVLHGGRLRDWLPANGVARGNGLIASVSPVPDFADLRVLTVLPESSVLASWRSHLTQVGILACIVILILLAGGLLVRRHS